MMTSRGPAVGNPRGRKRQDVTEVTGGNKMTRDCKKKPRVVVQEQCEKTKEEKKRQSKESDVPEHVRQEVESCYRLKMPEDFYDFWKFCENLDCDKPCDALKSSIGLQLVGPFEILAGKHKKTNGSKDVNFSLHWRFFYDPPEFQTIIIGDSKMQYHIGYFR